MQHGIETILLVDDEQAVLAMVGLILQNQGYHVLKASSAREALAISIQEPDIALIITDIQMPNMTGPELVRQLRSLGCALPVLYISGYAATESDCALGAELLKKPFAPKQLISKVNLLLRGCSKRLGSAICGSPDFKALGTLGLVLSGFFI